MVEFNEKNHEYVADGRKLISVTQLLSKHGLAPSYDAVDHELLRTASERGTLIHEEVKDFVDGKGRGFTEEAGLIADRMEALGMNGQSEVVLHNDIVAGTADFIGYDHEGLAYIVDIKTGSAKHMYEWSWQVALYANLYGQVFDRRQIWWAHEGQLDVLDCLPITDDNIQELFECERKGEVWKPNLDFDPAVMCELEAIETEKAKLEARVKELKAMEDELKASVLQSMEKHNVKTAEFGRLAVTYVAPTARRSLDEDKLKEVVGDLSSYYKITKTAASLRLKIK